MPAIFRRLFGGARRYGGYEIIEEIGEGGMSHVYKARRVSDGEIVALKVLKSETLPDPEKVERMARRSEGEIANALAHDNVVRTFEYGKRGNDYYLVMEYVDGPNLRQLILDGEVGDHKRRLDLIMQIGRGIEYIHSRGLVHRDICPKNMLIDSDGTPKIIDFGLAIVEKHNIPHLWERSGTAGYMAPEQIRGSPGDSRADIYAFGVTMYEILTGRRPFEGADDRVSKMQVHLNMDARPPSEFNPEVPPALDKIILETLAKDPERRPQSMNALMNKLALAIRQANNRSPNPAATKPRRGKHWDKGDIYRALGKANISPQQSEQ